MSAAIMRAWGELSLQEQERFAQQEAEQAEEAAHQVRNITWHVTHPTCPCCMAVGGHHLMHMRRPPGLCTHPQQASCMLRCVAILLGTLLSILLGTAQNTIMLSFIGLDMCSFRHHCCPIPSVCMCNGCRPQQQLRSQPCSEEA
jgi:hypothetical protein